MRLSIVAKHRSPKQFSFDKGEQLLDQALFLATQGNIDTTHKKPKSLSPPFRNVDISFPDHGFHSNKQWLNLWSGWDRGDQSWQTGGDGLRGAPTRFPKERSCMQLTEFSHDGLMWARESNSHGSNKRAVARALIRRGTGQCFVKSDLGKTAAVGSYWGRLYNRLDVVEPFFLTNTAHVYDLFGWVYGGGENSQALALRLAVARALVLACPDTRTTLKEARALEASTQEKLGVMAGRLDPRRGYKHRKR